MNRHSTSGDLDRDPISREDVLDYTVSAVHGMWEDETLIKANFLFRHSYHVEQFQCSKCKRYAAEITDYPDGMPKEFRYKFCPWCGAKMDGEKDG